MAEEYAICNTQYAICNMQRLSSRSFWIFGRFFPILFFDFDFILGKYQKLFCACEDILVAMSNATLQYVMK